MGGGGTTPEYTPPMTNSQNGFDDREANAQAPVQSYNNVLNGERSGDNNNAFKQWDSGEVSATEAAATDNGYSEDLAAHFDAQQTEVIEDTFEETVESYKESISSDTSEFQSMDAQDRFLGGVAASRSDSDISTRDIYDHEGANTLTIESTGDYESAEALKQDLFEQLDDTIEKLDDYVAGQVMANLDAIVAKPISRDHLDKDPVGGIIQTDRADAELHLNPETRNPLTNEGYEDIDPDELDGVDSPKEVDRLDEMTSKVSHSQFRSFIHHEISHVYHSRVVGVNHGGKLSSLQEAKQASPDQVDVDKVTRKWKENNDPSIAGGTGTTGSDVQTQVADEIEQAGERMIETMKGEVPQGEAPNTRVRAYQSSASDEMFACGYELYQRDVITSMTEQRPLADIYESHMVNAGWEETSIDSLQTTGSPDIDRNNVSDVHIPEDLNEDDVGEVALIEFEDDLGSNQSHAAGFVRTVTDDHVSFTYMGNDIVMRREDIDSVKRRDWGD